jgi:hypothetical protein
MRPSFPRLIRIIPKANITPTVDSAESSFKRKPQPHIIPQPLTPREEASTRVSTLEILLQRKADGLAKEEGGVLAKGAGWPVNLRVERPITKKMLSHVDEEVREDLKGIMKET